MCAAKKAYSDVYEYEYVYDLDEECSLTQVEFMTHVVNNKVKELQIHRVEEGYYITLTTNRNENWHVSTRRERTEPRIFKNYERMEQTLQMLELCSDIPIVMIYESS